MCCIEKMIILLLSLSAGFSLLAGTLVYQTSKKGTPQTASQVKIISIQDGRITIEQGKGRQTIPLGWVQKYYDSDVAGASFVDNTCDYDVRIIDVKMPKTGYMLKTDNDKRNKTTSECRIEYQISRKDEPDKSQTIKMPYFYLYVLTSRAKEYGAHPIYAFYYPREAKVKSKSYDEAKILEAVASMERPPAFKENDFRLNTGGHKQEFAGMGNRVAEIALKGIKEKSILAYHLDVWGKDKIVASKDWRHPNCNPGQWWWKKR